MFCLDSCFLWGFPRSSAGQTFKPAATLANAVSFQVLLNLSRTHFLGFKQNFANDNQKYTQYVLYLYRYHAGLEIARMIIINEKKIFETLQPLFSTRQPQRDRYVFIYHRLTVVLSLGKTGLTPKSSTRFVLSYNVLYCHTILSLLFNRLCLWIVFQNASGHPCLRHFLYLDLMEDGT